MLDDRDSADKAEYAKMAKALSADDCFWLLIMTHNQ